MFKSDSMHQASGVTLLLNKNERGHLKTEITELAEINQDKCCK